MPNCVIRTRQRYTFLWYFTFFPPLSTSHIHYDYTPFGRICLLIKIKKYVLVSFDKLSIYAPDKSENFVKNYQKSRWLSRIYSVLFYLRTLSWHFKIMPALKTADIIWKYLPYSDWGYLHDDSDSLPQTADSWRMHFTERWLYPGGHRGPHSDQMEYLKTQKDPAPRRFLLLPEQDRKSVV